MKYTCHSGGADGADMTWETEGKKYGIKTIGYSFPNHKQFSDNQKILSSDDLVEGWKHILLADVSLNRNASSDFMTKNLYVKNLLSRNWFQVKNAESVFAIGTFFNTKKDKVNGGTGWAVQMAIDNNKDVFLFNQIENEWYKYETSLKKFIRLYTFPKLTENFAGIGTRNINNFGISAIQELYKHTFNNG